MKRITCILIVLVLILSAPILSHTRGEVYGASLVVGAGVCVSSETILSLILSGLVVSGIVTAIDGVEEYPDLTQEEQSAIVEETYVDQRKIIDMLIEGGYFEGTGMEGFVEAYNAEIDSMSALENYISNREDLRDQLTVINGGGAPDGNGNVWASLGATAGVLGMFGQSIQEALKNFAKKEYAKEVGFSFPEEMPEGYNDLKYYSGYTVSLDKNGNVYFQSYGAHSLSHYNNYVGHSGYCIEAVRYKRYKLVDNEWVFDYQNEANSGSSSLKVLWLNEIEKMFFTNIYFGLAYDFPVTPYEGGMTDDDLPEELLEQKVNEYLENMGINSRYSENLYNAVQEDNPYKNVYTHLDEYDKDTPALIVDGNPEKVTQNITVPVTGTLVNGLPQVDVDTEEIKKVVADGAQDIADGIAISPEGAGKLPGTPYYPGLGSNNKFVVDGLADVFPFCIPFDLYDMLCVLDAEPQAPSFEWILPWVDGKSFTISVDLSVFDSVAEIIRKMELLSFCVGLALVTRSLIRG